MNTDIAVLDADSIAYKAAAANETRSITTVHIETGVTEHWDNRTKFRAYIKDTPHTEDMYTIEDVQDPRHISYGKSLINEMIKGYLNRLNTNKKEIYIGGEGNFRDFIPLPMEHTVLHGTYTGSKIAGVYKGKRAESIRPVQLKELRAWMIHELGAIVVNGQEVDDVGSIRAYEGWKAKDVGGRIIQVTEDKDALGCSGWLFNPAKMDKPVKIQGFGELHEVKGGVKGTGRLWLYYQALYGDAVDCYHGVSLAKVIADKAGKTITFGEKAAYKVLVNCKDDKEALAAVYGQYLKWYPQTVTYLAHDGMEYTKSAIEIMQMYFDCSHMRRWEDDRIDVSSLLHKLEVI